MFRYYINTIAINTINYIKLIDEKGSFQLEDKKFKFKTSSRKGKCKTYNLNNSVKRHH